MSNVCFCSAVVLFRTAADADSLLDPKRLSLILYDALQLPRFIGEIAAFGGSNVDPSVQSCFLLVRLLLLLLLVLLLCILFVHYYTTTVDLFL